MTARDIIIHWYHGQFPPELLGRFVRPVHVIAMPKVGDGAFTGFRESVEELGQFPLREVLANAGVRPLRVCVIGFSASVQGVTAFLRSKDGGNIETAIAIDGIHGGVDAWVNFGRIAAFGLPDLSPLPPGQRCCVITHSSVPGPGGGRYPSTTETAAEIIAGVLGPREATGEPVEGIWGARPSPKTCTSRYQARRIEYTTTPNKYAVREGNFHVFGYENLDPAGECDHIYQAERIMPLVCERLLVDRWNSEDPLAGCRIA